MNSDMELLIAVLAALYFVCLFGLGATVFLVRRCLREIRERQVLHIKLVADQALVDEIANDAAEQLDARGVFAGERVVH
jgi:hypothetical protein